MARDFDLDENGVVQRAAWRHAAPAAAMRTRACASREGWADE